MTRAFLIAAMALFMAAGPRTVHSTPDATPPLSDERAREVEKFIQAIDRLALPAAELVQLVEKARTDNPVPAARPSGERRSALLERLSLLREIEAFLNGMDAPAPEPAREKPEPPSGPPADDALALYVNTVKPLLDSRCLMCHDGNRAKAGFDLSSAEGLMKGGGTGPAVVPGSAEESPLYLMAAHLREPFMPYQMPKLEDGEVEALRRWIDGGAPLPESGEDAAGAAGIAKTVSEEDRAFWSFQPLSNAKPPAVEDGGWVRNPIDRFVLAKLEAKGLEPAKEASRRTLIRRLYFDFLGLPPSPEEVEAFVNDDSPDAYQALVDRLLDNPHYGERWGRHWLDVARYADSGGYEFDVERPNAYPYRDFVIKALNEDMPYDRFVRWQLAGDEFAPDNPQAIAATGFCTAGPTISNQQTELNRYNELDDMLSTAVQGVLGLSIACARCHDHKFDPIPQYDYYRMLAAFTPSKRQEAYLLPREEAQKHREIREAWKRELKAAEHELESWTGPLDALIRHRKIDGLPLDLDQKDLLFKPLDKNNPEQRKLYEEYGEQVEIDGEDRLERLRGGELERYRALTEAVEAIKASEPEEPPKALSLTDGGREAGPSYFLRRGSPGNKAGEVEPGFLQVLTPPGMDFINWLPETDQETGTTLRRSALAEWLLDTERGAGALAARVMVNRLWQHHFGHGIVRTPGDFGAQGERPTHPDLLDWLAGQLIENEWRLKPLHRLIAASAAYRMGTEYREAAGGIDPDNRLLWRRRPLRVEAEILRDSMLAVAGNLNRHMYGPGVYPWMHPDAIATGSTKKWPEDAVNGPDTWRRSVYVNIRRSVLMPMFTVFDFPDPAAPCAKRETTVIAPQALSLLNNAFSREQSARFARRTLEEAGPDPGDQVKRAFERALGRPPDGRETGAALRFLAAQANRYAEGGTLPAAADLLPAEGGRDLAYQLALTDFCQSLFNLNEFLYVD